MTDAGRTHPGPRYSVVVPVYESNDSVVHLVERIVAVFETSIRQAYEIILVDDGSRTARTWTTLSRLVGERPDVVSAIRLTRNYGKSSAVLCGLRHARGQWIITIDDDLQQRPEDIPQLIVHEDHDVVVANFRQRKHSRFVVATSWIKGQFDRLILELPCRMSPLKLIRASVVQAMLLLQTNRPFIPAMLVHVTTDIYPVVVPHEASSHGRSRYNFSRRLRQMSDLLIGNSNLLLRCVGGIGAVLAGWGVIYAVYVVCRRLFGTLQEPGWATLVAINLVFGGLTLITLGIIGEYLIRILDRSTGKPAYHIREIVDRSEKSVAWGGRQPPDEDA
jgi:glycosyltransferase involved in cell wall biosynthesis